MGLVQVAQRQVERIRFRGSATYWEDRYAQGGNSGAGSYGEVAEFKAQVLNDFVRSHRIGSVIEFGCGDGAQLSLADYPRYIGLDVAPTAIDLCRNLHGGDPTKSFIAYDPAHFVNNGALTAELGLSLDVLLHLVEDDVLERYLTHLAEASTRYVVVFAQDGKKATTSPHVRYRDLDEWKPMLAGWDHTDTIANPHQGEDSVADFFVFERR